MAHQSAEKNPIQIDEREILLKILREVKGLQTTFKRNDDANKKNLKILTDEVQALRNELQQFQHKHTKIEEYNTHDMPYGGTDSDSKDYDTKLEEDDDEDEDGNDVEMPISMKILAEVRLLKERVEKSDEFNEKMFIKLTREVRALRAQLNELKNANSDSEYEAPNLPEMPFNSMSDFQEFDIMLAEDEDMVTQLKKSFKRIDAKDYALFLRTAIRKIVTDELAVNLTWRGTPNKPSIQKFKITTILKDSCRRKFCSVDGAEMNKVLQQHFLHAKDRVTKKKQKSDKMY